MRRGSDADSERGVTRASTSAGDAGESQVSLETLLADVRPTYQYAHEES